MKSATLFDARTDGERVWEAIQAASDASPGFVARMFAPCTVKRYDGQVMALAAPSAVHAEFLRQHCTAALGAGRDRVMPGLKLVVMVQAEESA